MSLNDMGSYGGLSIDEEATSHELGKISRALYILFHN